MYNDFRWDVHDPKKPHKNSKEYWLYLVRNLAVSQAKQKNLTKCNANTEKATSVFQT